MPGHEIDIDGLSTRKEGLRQKKKRVEKRIAAIRKKKILQKELVTTDGKIKELEEKVQKLELTKKANTKFSSSTSALTSSNKRVFDDVHEIREVLESVVAKPKSYWWKDDIKTDVKKMLKVIHDDKRGETLEKALKSAGLQKQTELVVCMLNHIKSNQPDANFWKVHDELNILRNKTQF